MTDRLDRLRASREGCRRASQEKLRKIGNPICDKEQGFKVASNLGVDAVTFFPLLHAVGLATPARAARRR